MCDGDKNKWKAPFLKKDTIIKCTKKDEASLRNCLDYRLGRQILNDTKFNTNTQKSEAANRVYNLRNPRNLTFARNFSGRIHSAVHQINNGPSQSLCLQLEAVGAPITANSRVAHQLKSKEKKHCYNKDYKKTEYAKTRRSTLRINKYRLYDSHTANKDTVHYKKQMLEGRRPQFRLPAKYIHKTVRTDTDRACCDWLLLMIRY